jgi:hypothetical protein
VFFGAGVLFGGGMARGAELPSVRVDDDGGAAPAIPPLEPAHDAGRSPATTAPAREARCAPLTQRHWYGWQTLATDGGGIGLIILGGALQFEGPLAVTAVSVGVGSLFLGGPIVHIAHGRVGIGILDFGMRLTLPAIGGYLASGQCEGECGGQVLLGLMVGLAPIWIDAGLLASESVPLEREHRTESFVPRALGRLGVTEIHPTTRVTHRSLELGLAGSF